VAAKSTRNWNQSARDRLRSSLSKDPCCPQALTVAGGKLGRLLWPCFPARSGPFFPLSSSFIPGQRPEVIERKAFLRALRIRGQVSSKAEVAGVKNKCRVCVYVCVCVCGGAPGGQVGNSVSHKGPEPPGFPPLFPCCQWCLLLLRV